MKRTLLLFLFFIYAFSGFCQHPFIQNLKGVATITMPDTPKFQYEKPDTFYYVNRGDIYMAGASKVIKSLKDMFTPNSNDSTYDQEIDGMVSGYKGKLMYKRPVNANELNGVEFCIRSKVNSTVNYFHYQTFYFNNVLIIFGVMSKQELPPNDKVLKDFFGTFKLSIKGESVRQDNISHIAYSIGILIAILLIIAIISALGFGVVYIIKKITYK